jgi:opacity protein-like surface antigen
MAPRARARHAFGPLLLGPRGIGRIGGRIATSVLAYLTLARPSLAEPSDLPPEIGYNYGETETARITALGGGLRALGNSTSALFQNPANMAVTRVYHVSALAQIWPQAGRQSYGAAAVDSIVSSTGIAGGLGGTWNQQDPDGVARQYNDIRVGLAMPFAETLFVGASGRMLSLSQDGEGPLGTSRVSGGLEGERIVQAFTFDIGATLRPLPELSLALVGHNLTDTAEAFLPLMLGGAVGFGTRDFSIEGNVVLDSTTWDRTTTRWMGGAELLLADRVGLRAGYRFDTAIDQHAASGGIAYIDQRFSVDGAMRQSFGDYAATTIVFGFTLHVEATGLTPDPAAGF